MTVNEKIKPIDNEINQKKPKYDLVRQTATIS